MKKAGQFRLVLVTAPDLKVARRLARCALDCRVAACANLIPRVESHYWWKGKLEKSAEVLIVFKTRARQIGKLERVVLENHPYDTPEFVALTLSEGNERYLDWIGGNSAVGADDNQHITAKNAKATKLKQQA
jgi:periplasmic divalent cation tolerance protein